MVTLLFASQRRNGIVKKKEQIEMPVDTIQIFYGRFIDQGKPPNYNISWNVCP